MDYSRTKEDIIKRFNDFLQFVKINTECSCISSDLDFINANSKLKFICKCGKEFTTTPANFKDGKRHCKDCAPKKNIWNIDTIRKHLKDNLIDYEVLDLKYEKTKENRNKLKVLLQCENKNHQPYWCSWANFLTGYRCQECFFDSKNATKWDYEKVKSLFKEKGLTLLENSYRNSGEYLKCKDEDGYIVYTSVGSLLIGRKPCWFYKNNTIDNVKLFLSKNNPEYEIVSEEFKTVKDKYIFKYLGKGLKEGVSIYFESNIDYILNRNITHPFLNKTKMEEVAERVLTLNNIKYIPQYIDIKCRNPKTNFPLRFDIALIDCNDNVYKIIELDGESHDMVVDYWGGEEGLKERQYRDNIKNKYCSENNIDLIRIHYKDINRIEEILKKELDIKNE